MANKHHQLLNAAVDVGYMLLANGAEIYRVEESIQRILYAYGTKNADVFAIPSCIIVSINDQSNEAITKVRRLYTRDTNFDKVEQTNDLCRRICAEKPEYAWIKSELHRIDERPTYGYGWQLLGYAAAAGTFAVFFGGGIREALCAAVLGLIIRVVTKEMDKLKANPFFINIIASGIIAIFAMSAVSLQFAANVDKIIIGALMLLVPGVAVTNSMRDIIAGDLIAGLMKMVEALMVATAIAIGTGGALAISRYLWGG